MLLFCMTLAGTMPLLLCLLLLLIRRKNFSPQLGRYLTLLSLAGYLIPFQVFKFLFPQDVLEEIHSIEQISYFVNFNNKEAVSVKGISIWMSGWLFVIALFWLCLVIGFSVYEIAKYQRLIRKLKQTAAPYQYDVQGIGNIPYYVSRQLDSPYTIGFLKPIVVSPWELEHTALSEMILKHEYSHLRRHDSTVKLLCLLTICLHFFNPLAMLTLLLYTRFSENLADEEATGNHSISQRKQYATTLIQFSSRTRQVPVVWRSNLFGDKRTIKRRVELIMMRNKKVSKLGTAAAILTSVLLSSSTALAYTPMQTVEVLDETQVTEEFVTFKKTGINLSDFSIYDTYFRSNDNTVTPLNSSAADTDAIICTHNFEEGYADRHYSQDDGSCIVKTYTAKICTKCNHLVLIEKIGEIHYPTCPHK